MFLRKNNREKKSTRAIVTLEIDEPYLSKLKAILGTEREDLLGGLLMLAVCRVQGSPRSDVTVSISGNWSLNGTVLGDAQTVILDDDNIADAPSALYKILAPAELCFRC